MILYGEGFSPTEIAYAMGLTEAEVLAMLAADPNTVVRPKRYW